MKKLNILFTIGLVILLSLALVAGCQPQVTPEPAPETSEPAPETPAPEAPTPETPTPETPTPPPETEAPPDEPEETAEPTAHSSAYIKFDGVDGESKDTAHQNWSEIVAFSQAMHLPSDGATGAARRAGGVVLEDIVIVKQVDKSSPKLAEACANGKVFPKVEIHLTGPSEGSTCQGTFYAYELTNVRITSYTVSGSNPLAYNLIAPAPDTTMPTAGPFIVQAVDAPMEEVALNFEEIKVTYTECDSAGQAKGNVEYTWKVEEGES